AALARGVVAVLPVGSTEQHGPMGLIGTDAICAQAVADRAGEQADALVLPTLAYTPAPFNTAFPGTISITPKLLCDQVVEICEQALAQGILGIYALNGHGANLAPLAEAQARLPKEALRVQSWWAPEPVDALRKNLYGPWEGMHATPSEVAITQHLHGAKPAGAAARPPEQLNSDYMRAHAGDRHGPPLEHRAQFPDGRVGSHSALASPEAGAEVLEVAVAAIAKELQAFCEERRATR
ncbi:MAG: creatininase family protein, partial [Pseudomonadota bacterium]